MATPERTRKTHVLALRLVGLCHSPRMPTMASVTAKMMTVRINVAMFELTCATPSLPNIAVSAAKNAEPSAKSCQLRSITIVTYQ